LYQATATAATVIGSVLHQGAPKLAPGGILPHASS